MKLPRTIQLFFLAFLKKVKIMEQRLSNDNIEIDSTPEV